MSNIIINVEFLAGTCVAQAVTEARTLAIQNDLAFVKFKFNGIPFSISQRADVDDCVKQYNDTFETSEPLMKRVMS